MTRPLSPIAPMQPGRPHGEYPTAVPSSGGTDPDPELENLEYTVRRPRSVVEEANTQTSRIAVVEESARPAQVWSPPDLSAAFVDRPPVRRPAVKPAPRRRAPQNTFRPMQILRERWFVASATFLLTAAAAVAVGRLLPQTYEATATVSLAATPSASTAFADLLSADAATEADQAGSIGLANRVADSVGDGRTGQELRDSIRTTTPMEANVLRFTFSSDSAEDAALVANVYAESYLAERKEIYETSVGALSDELSSKIDELNPEQDQALIDQLVNERAELPGAYYPGRISNEATAESASATSGMLAFLAAGVAGGAILAVFVAILADRLDPRIRNRRRLVEIFGEDVVLIRRRDVDEAPRRLVVMLRAMAQALPVARVAVVSVGRKCADVSVERFRGQLDSDAVRPGGISRGAPIYFVDSRGARSRAQQLEFAAAADATVVVASRRDSRRSLVDLVQALDKVGRSGAVVCLFLSTRKDGKP